MSRASQCAPKSVFKNRNDQHNFVDQIFLIRIISLIMIKNVFVQNNCFDQKNIGDHDQKNSDQIIVLIMIKKYCDDIFF